MNLLTQAFLWAMLSYFWQHYLPTLFLSETVIGVCESVMLRAVPSNRLTMRQAALLSFLMNASSFGAGWFLPL